MVLENGAVMLFNARVLVGTSRKTNSIAMDVVSHDTIFTNVGETSDGRFFWEGLEDQVLANAPPGLKIKDWQGTRTRLVKGNYSFCCDSCSFSHYTSCVNTCTIHYELCISGEHAYWHLDVASLGFRSYTSKSVTRIGFCRNYINVQ